MMYKRKIRTNVNLQKEEYPCGRCKTVSGFRRAENVTWQTTQVLVNVSVSFCQTFCTDLNNF